MATKKKTVDTCETKEAVEAWAAEMEAPLHTEIAEIDRQVVELSARKRELHKKIDAIEAQSAERRYELRGDDAGPDQVLVLAGGYSERDLAAMRQIIAQRD